MMHGPARSIRRTAGRRLSGGMSALVCVSIVLAAAVASAAQQAELLDRVLAVVSGSIITLSDARAAADLGLVDVQGARDPIAVALKWLIERRLVLDEALRYESVTRDPEAVEPIVSAIRRRFPSDAAWAAALSRLGLSEDDVRSLVADTRHAQAYLDNRFAARMPVSEDEAREYYGQQAAAFVRDGRQLSFDEARPDIEARVQRDRRASAITEFVGRLRRRADVSELYLPAR